MSRGRVGAEAAYPYCGGRNVKCPKCGFMKTVPISVLQWRCPTCKHWLAVKPGRPMKSI